MKKRIFSCIGIAIVAISGYVFMWNGFSNIERINVQTFDSSTESYGEAKVITDDATLKKVTKFLNQANREKDVLYEMEHREDYRITVHYEDGALDSFLAWNHEGLNVFLIWPAESDVLRVTQKNQRTAFLEILNE